MTTNVLMRGRQGDKRKQRDYGAETRVTWPQAEDAGGHQESGDARNVFSPGASGRSQPF